MGRRTAGSHGENALRGSLLLGVTAAVIAAAGQVLLKRLMGSVGPVGLQSLADLPALIGSLARQPALYAAIAVYILGFSLWLVVLSRLQLSVAYPILALTYILVPAASQIFFGESIPALRWAGTIVIMVGIVLVGLSYYRQ